jgi:hypothetical protein
MGVLVGGAPWFGDGGEGAGEVGGIVDELEGEVDADLRNFVEERLREEAGRLCDGEADAGARDGVEGVEHGAEGFWAEARVEVLAEGGYHRRRVTRGEGGGQWVPQWKTAIILRRQQDRAAMMGGS